MSQRGSPSAKRTPTPRSFFGSRAHPYPATSNLSQSRNQTAQLVQTPEMSTRSHHNSGTPQPVSCRMRLNAELQGLRITNLLRKEAVLVDTPDGQRWQATYWLDPPYAYIRGVGLDPNKKKAEERAAGLALQEVRRIPGQPPNSLQRPSFHPGH